MRFLSVAERELRTTARRTRTYLVRWITGLAFFGLLIWLLWVFDGFHRRNAAPDVFQVLTVLVFIYTLFVGTAVTADAISAEKREGTLGLLFLTNLNSFEIIFGKLCSSALVTVYGLFSVFPMLGLLLLFGGISLDLFWQTVLALVNTIFFAVAMGFVASVLCVRQFTAVALATGSALVIGAGLLGAAAILNSLRCPRIWVDTIASVCPLYCLVSAGGNRIFGQNHYWLSMGLVACLSLGGLALATLWLARNWRDRPRRWPVPGGSSFLARWRQVGATGRARLRRRLLDRNPFFWLGSRQRISAPLFMMLTVLLVAITVYVTSPFFSRLFRVRPGGLEGFVFAWMWLGIAIHALVLYYAAMIASQRTAEDKQSGALELILSTPVTEQFIARGFWLAYWRRLFFPALAAVLIHLFFIWMGAALLVFEVDQVPRGMTPTELLLRALFKLPVSGSSDDWNFWLAARIVSLLLLLFVGLWFTLGLVGRWLGLRMKHPGFAPLVALGLISVPPVLVFSIFCYVAGELRFFRMPDRIAVPIVMWTAFGIGALNCFLLSRWAAIRLRRDFRITVIGRFQLPRARFWWLPGRRTVVRFAVWVAVIAATAMLLTLGFYGYHNWRSRRNWADFQQALAKNGESLDIAPLMVLPVPDESNFAKTAAFRRFAGGDATTKRLFAALQRWETQRVNYGDLGSVEWIAQEFAPLAEYVGLAIERVPPGLKTNRVDVAPVILEGLQSQRELLRDIATAARLPHLQISTNRNAMAVLHPKNEAISALSRLQLLFCIRACAFLAANQSHDAGEDVLTSLHLARLARQLPDAESATRAQMMLGRSFQPLWEGLAEHQWNETQLAAFQAELMRFNPIADFTNTVRRVVLAHIDIWRTYPGLKVSPHSVPIAGGSGSYLEVDGARLRPQAWWFDDCIQLHRFGARALAHVDVTKELVHPSTDWTEGNGLPIGSETEQFIGQYQWWWPIRPTLLAFSQNALHQAVIACALERHFLAKGEYPETLNRLVPTYLERIPNDVVRGRPMIYERTDDGRYMLRGVGQDQQDGRKSKSSDDWLWWYGTNAPPGIPQIGN